MRFVARVRLLEAIFIKERLFSVDCLFYIFVTDSHIPFPSINYSSGKSTPLIFLSLTRTLKKWLESL